MYLIVKLEDAGCDMGTTLQVVILGGVNRQALGAGKAAIREEI